MSIESSLSIIRATLISSHSFSLQLSGETVEKVIYFQLWVDQTFAGNCQLCFKIDSFWFNTIFPSCVHIIGNICPQLVQKETLKLLLFILITSHDHDIFPRPYKAGFRWPFVYQVIGNFDQQSGLVRISLLPNHNIQKLLSRYRGSLFVGFSNFTTLV